MSITWASIRALKAATATTSVEQVSISENNAIKEFKITKQDISRGIDEGKLTWSRRSAHGHPYLLLNREEVIKFAATCPKDPVLVAKAAEKELKETIAARTNELAAVTRELEGIEARKLWLIQRKAELTEYLAANKTSGKKRKASG